jgi:hypothetical protein
LPGASSCTYRKLRSIVAHHHRRSKRIGAGVARGRSHHDAAQSPPATQAAMIVLTIQETTILTLHLLLFPYAGCDTTYAVLRLPIEAVSPHISYSSE